MSNTISILVASEDEEDCIRILAVLSDQNDFLIAGVEKDAADTVIKSERLKPDVLIMDLQPHGMDGPDLAPIIHRRSPSTSIIMMCDRDETDYASMALRAGISGFLLRNVDMNKLIPAVKIVYLGGYYVSDSITLKALDTITFIKQFPGQVTGFKNSHLSFTSTERSIIESIAQGLSDEEIAKYLNFSAGTVRNCLAAIKRKTKLKNRMQIVIFSLVFGIISMEQLDIFKMN